MISYLFRSPILYYNRDGRVGKSHGDRQARLLETVWSRLRDLDLDLAIQSVPLVSCGISRIVPCHGIPKLVPLRLLSFLGTAIPIEVPTTLAGRRVLRISKPFRVLYTTKPYSSDVGMDVRYD